MLPIVLLLEADDSFVPLNKDFVPVTDPTVCLHLAQRQVKLVEEADLVDPILARFYSNLANLPIWRQNQHLVTLVDSRPPSKWRRDVMR